MKHKNYEDDRSISSLRWPGFRPYCRRDDVEAFAQSISEGGSYPLPLVSGETGQLVLGKRTVAAMHRLGHKKIRCLVVWADDTDTTALSAPLPEPETAVSSPGSIAKNVQGFRRDIESFGLPVDEVFEAQLNVLQLRYHKASMAVRGAKQHLDAIARSPAPHYDVALAVDALRRTWELIDACSPAGICPYCKGLPIECGQCRGVLWVGKSTLDAAPPELLDDEDLRVLVDGKTVPYRKAEKG